MDTNAAGMCDVCRKPASIHITEIRDGVMTSRSFCVEHAPPEMRDRIVRKQQAAVAIEGSEPVRRAAFVAEIERLTADIEARQRRIDDACRRRIGDAD